jgi:hypothetical protein
MEGGNGALLKTEPKSGLRARIFQERVDEGGD